VYEGDYYINVLFFLFCILCFVDRASRYNRVNKNQINAQRINEIYYE